LTREAEEIQKIVVFEGAFEKIFSIIKEEGGSDGDVVVQVTSCSFKNIYSTCNLLKIWHIKRINEEPILLFRPKHYWLLHFHMSAYFGIACLC
jgi:hypothetical protein